jgi:hypothetical protein
MSTPNSTRVCFTALLCLIVGVGSFAQSNSNDGPLTNASIVKLVKAGFKEKSIITIIASRPAKFDLSTDQMIDLKRAGVGEKIILAMLARQQGIDFDAEDWDNDAFFNPGNSKPPDNNSQGQSGNNGSSAEVFGSSGGSRGSSESRGARDSNQNETVTTGTATVRILRPASEAADQPKLQKTASLTNVSIIELVEAGFSEGTIIRRIEQSPVEFDLSNEKIAELRKHRVSEKIVAAMKTAMGDEASTPPASGNLSPTKTP